MYVLILLDSIQLYVISNLSFSHSQSLCGCKINVPTLSGVSIPIHMTEIVKPSTQRRIPGEGLPHPKETTKRGDLIINFDIKFPDYLTETTRQIMYDVLPGK